MRKKRKQRRGPHSSAWHWKQTDRWFFTRPGTQSRVPLVDDLGKRIRGPENKKDAELALARVKVARQWRPAPEAAVESEWLVAKVCSEYIQDCRRRAASGSLSVGYRDEAVRYLNSLCDYCGALPVAQLKALQNN